jgi:hypothetical protein
MEMETIRRVLMSEQISFKISKQALFRGAPLKFKEWVGQLQHSSPRVHFDTGLSIVSLTGAMWGVFLARYSLNGNDILDASGLMNVVTLVRPCLCFGNT